MKNITLSIPEDLLVKSREYARKHGKSLNDMVRELLKTTVNQGSINYLDSIEKSRKNLGIDTRDKFTRDEIYER